MIKIFHLEKPRVACIDLEDTLVEGSIWHRLNGKFGVTRSEERELFGKFMDGRIDYENWVKSLAEKWKNSTVMEPTQEKINNVVREFVVKEGAQNLINSLRKGGYTTISISGAPKVYSKRVSKHLGIERNIPTHELVFDSKKKKLSNIAILNDYDFSKKHYVERIRLANGSKKIIAIGDNINDLDMCFAADKGFLIRDDDNAREIDYERLKEKGLYTVKLPEIPELL